jgi:hypothetical protein
MTLTVRTISTPNRAHVDTKESELLANGYLRVSGSEKLLRRREYVRSQASGTATSFEGAGVYEIKWVE